MFNHLKNCNACRLYKTRRKVVTGKGSLPADILFMGEAPGRSEDVMGIPFFGSSGKLLDVMLKDACLRYRTAVGGISSAVYEDSGYFYRYTLNRAENTVERRKMAKRHKTPIDAAKIASEGLDLGENRLLKYFVTNTVLCHPTDSVGGDNREPTTDEVLACTSNVMEIYNAVNPRIVVFIGKVSERFYGKEFKEHDSIQHPAFLLRSGGVKSSWYETNIRKLVDIFGRLY